MPYDRGAVFIRAEGGRLVPLALEGASFVDWDTSLAEDTPLGKAWRSATPTHAPQSLSGGGTPGQLAAGRHTVLPLRMGSRTFGLVALETRRSAATNRSGFVAPPTDPRLMAPAMELVDETALRLETALLFGEVRSIATSEERRRLAREIHDGVAQELASLGYAVDDLVAAGMPIGRTAKHANVRGGSDNPIADDLRTLRKEITRIVSELRLSIFDLRSEVQAQVGLGGALSDYVRAVSVGTTFSVHVTLDEAPDRLPIAAEAELLRIAQEAITNARKHAEAEHLWVTCRVDPPFAHLRIEDDGNGMGTGRHDSFGLEVMRERAARLGAELTIGAARAARHIRRGRAGRSTALGGRSARRCSPNRARHGNVLTGTVALTSAADSGRLRDGKGFANGRDSAAR